MTERVVSDEWLLDRLDAVSIVDVRDEWEYEGIGHIPGAVNVPFDAIRATEHAAETGEGHGMLPGEDRFSETMGGVGITETDHVVAYDDHHGVFAARLLVTAELYGHPPELLHLLDGDFSAWRLDHETTDTSPERTPATYEIHPPTESPLVDASTVATALTQPDTVVVDTRSEDEFREGHLPGAVRLDWRELINDETRGLRSRTAMENLLGSRGITRDRRILLYCNTARRISHTYIVLKHLDYENVAFYEGSLTEWKAEGRPVETG